MNLENKTVLILGDSIMNGAGNYNYGVGEFLNEMFNMKYIKHCVNGATVAYWKPDRSWIITQVKDVIKLDLKPDYIIFDGFTNDCCTLEGTSAPRTKLGDINCREIDIQGINETNNFSECFKSILIALKKYYPNSKLLFVRPHKMARRLESLQQDYGQRAVDLCKQCQIDVCDIYNESSLNTFDDTLRKKYTFDRFNDGKGDATHPNKLCYEEIYMPLIISHLLNMN